MLLFTLRTSGGLSFIAIQGLARNRDLFEFTPRHRTDVLTRRHRVEGKMKRLELEGRLNFGVGFDRAVVDLK